MNPHDRQPTTREPASTPPPRRARWAAALRPGARWAALGMALVLLAAGVRGWQLSDLHAPPPSLLLLDRHGEFLAESADAVEAGYGYWPLQALPPRVVAATLALEDRRFWDHPGVDLLAIARAVWQNLRSGERVSGASTIAMQVARMQNPGPRSYGRKLVEAFTGLFLTLRHGREAVLGHYLRLVPYGNNIHGIAYAARRYLDKPVADLSWAEIAFLSAIPQAPSATNPFDYRGRLRAIRRGQRILVALRAKGVIEPAAYALAGRQLERIRVPAERRRPVSALHAILRLEQELRNRDRATASDFRIHTSLDLELQRKVEQLARARLGRWQQAAAEAVAVIVLDRRSAEVLAWLGSSDYFGPHGGAIDYTGILRSPGSALKPFIYALALDRGVIGPGTVLYDLPAFSNGISNIDYRYLGPLLPRQALANSRNVPATRLTGSVGLDEVAKFLFQLGLDDGERPASHYGVGIAVGAMPTTLERLVRAYGALSNDGELSDPVWVRGGAPHSRKRVLSVAAARLVTLFLADPLARLPSFPRMGTTEYPFPVALKTGTSQGYRDAWTVAWSRDYLVGVWVGRADTLPMHRLGGAGSAAALAQDVLGHLHQDQLDGLADLAFQPPPDHQPFSVCALTGQRARGLCDPTVTEWFPAAAPPEPDTRHVRAWVDRRTHLPASLETPREHLVPRTFLKIPVLLQEWADERRLPVLPMDFHEEETALAAVIGPADTAPPQVAIRQSEQPVRLTLQSPAGDLRLYSNPEVPPALNTLPLRLEVEPEVPQVIWYVDGKPWQLAGPPYTVRWPLTPGRHTIQARLPYRSETSAISTVLVD